MDGQDANLARIMEGSLGITNKQDGKSQQLADRILYAGVEKIARFKGIGL